MKWHVEIRMDGWRGRVGAKVLDGFLWTLGRFIGQWP